MRAPLFSHPNALRIFGPAGSGKTREGVGILRQHVEDGDFDVSEGIICSFTRVAARDIARRVRDDDGEPSRYHCTLHALVKRYYGFDTSLAEQRLDEFFEGEHIDYKRSRGGDAEEWLSNEGDGATEGAQLMAFWSLCRNRMIALSQGREEYAPSPGIEQWWTGDAMDRLWERYCGWKQSEGLIDFTDMLEMALESPPTGAWWPFFLLDEAQDSTPLQWAVANVFAAQCDVVYLLGDDDQAIYSWSGATPDEFLAAGVSAEDTLNVNYRCHSRILDQAQAFIRQNRVRHDKAMTAANEGGAIESAFELPELDVGQSTFVLARAYYLLHPLMNELEERGYPFVDRRGSKGVNGKAATQLNRYMRLVQNERLTVDEWRLLCEAIPSRGPWVTRGAKKRLKDLDPVFRAQTFVRATDLVDYGGTDTLLAAIQQGELDPLGRMSPERLGYLKAVMTNYGEEFLAEHRASQVCQVGPIHGFKGLEADRVVLHSGMPPAATREAWSNPEPERRVFYVAMTRAKTQLTHLQGRAFAQWDETL